MKTITREKHKKENEPAALERLHQLEQQPSPTATSWWRHARNFLWLLWVGCLVWLAEASLKHWLIIFALLLLTVTVYLFSPVEEPPQYGLDHDFTIESSEFLPSITALTDTPFAAGNRVDILSNGDEFYPAMLDAIAQAQRTITIEAYIYWAGEIGKKFAQAISAKSRAGVKVKILLDAVGSSTISDEILDTLKGGGCQVEWYHPVRWYSINRINNRTHRKSLIIDGRIGFTGGAGIADHWLGHAQDPKHWRDTNLRMEGSSVLTLQTGFAQNWLETTRELISGDAYFPPPQQSGQLAVQSVLSQPETGSSTVRILYYLSIVCARKSIFIANPYFIPDEQAIDILVKAKQRGVDVKLMLAGEHNDNWIARGNSVRLYGRLLAAGVEIHEYQPTMMHHKFLVCDNVWATVGTTNFDNRSFALNDENNVCVYDQGFAERLHEIFLNDLPLCHRVSLDEWRNRGAFTKVREWFVSLLRSQV